MIKRLVFSAVVLGAWLAFAQDRSVSIRQRDLSLSKVEVSVLPDGGCAGEAHGAVSPPSVDIQAPRQLHPLSVADCAAMKAAGSKMLALDKGVGDGGRP